ncbi:hypothetical protein PR048_015149 [Dryococelus australis]|uniref:Uncharacterized protein n=1 Tax=Dryococelus australis TaxID=614101 RepID=A0ABQ9HG61_9NEOP|nr:hypothetical protein PR048_015149 [Dryococelus australis]
MLLCCHEPFHCSLKYMKTVVQNVPHHRHYPHSASINRCYNCECQRICDLLHDSDWWRLFSIRRYLCNIKHALHLNKYMECLSQHTFRRHPQNSLGSDGRGSLRRDWTCQKQKWTRLERPTRTTMIRSQVLHSLLSGCCNGNPNKENIFLGVRNKYCSFCARLKSTAKSGTMPEHQCAKKLVWSVFIDGTRYNSLVVHRNLIDAIPYRPEIQVQKIERRNHILRNYMNKVRDICGNCKLGNLPLRTAVQANAQRLRTTVVSATNTEKGKAAIAKDILNSHHLTFINHENFRERDYLYHGLSKSGEGDLIPQLRQAGMWQDFLTPVHRLANNQKLQEGYARTLHSGIRDILDVRQQLWLPIPKDNYTELFISLLLKEAQVFTQKICQSCHKKTNNTS